MTQTHSILSTLKNWFMTAPPAPQSVPGSRRRAQPLNAGPSQEVRHHVRMMWVIAGPEGMPVREAKKRIGVRTGPNDLVEYRRVPNSGIRQAVPRLVSCQKIETRPLI